MQNEERVWEMCKTSHVWSAKGTPLLEKIAGWSAVYFLVLLYLGMLDTETQSAQSRAAILQGTCSQATKNALFVIAAILGNLVSVLLFDVMVFFTEINDHEHGTLLSSQDCRVPDGRTSRARCAI